MTTATAIPTKPRARKPQQFGMVAMVDPTLIDRDAGQPRQEIDPVK